MKTIAAMIANLFIGRVRALLQHQSGAARCRAALIARLPFLLVCLTKGNRAAPRFVPGLLLSVAQLCKPTRHQRARFVKLLSRPGESMGCDIGHRRGGAGMRKTAKHGEVSPASHGPIKKLGASDELFNRCCQPATVAPHYRPGRSCILLCSATGVGIFELRGLWRAYAHALSDVAV